MWLHSSYEAPGSPNLVAVGMPQLRQLMQVQVTDCYFPKDKYLNRRKNFCFVTFATQQVRLCDSSIRAHWPTHRKMWDRISSAPPVCMRHKAPGQAQHLPAHTHTQNCPAPAARTACSRNAHLNMQAAEKAAAQSDREINGYRIESISVTHDRHTHYQRQAATPAQVLIACLVWSSSMPRPPVLLRWGTCRCEETGHDISFSKVLQCPPWTCA